MKRRTILCAPVLLAQPTDELALRLEAFAKTYNRFIEKENTGLNCVNEFAVEMSKRWRAVENSEGYPKDAIPKCKPNT